MQVRRAEVVELVAPRAQQCVGNGQIWQDKKGCRAGGRNIGDEKAEGAGLGS